MQITIIGLDLAKHWFQVHGVRRRWTRGRSRAAVAQRRDPLFPVARAVSGRHGGLRTAHHIRRGS